jgi:hypothetical protein
MNFKGNIGMNFKEKFMIDICNHRISKSTKNFDKTRLEEEHFNLIFIVQKITKLFCEFIYC